MHQSSDDVNEYVDVFVIVRQDELLVFTCLIHVLDTTPLLVSKRLFQYPCCTGVAHRRGMNFTYRNIFQWQM